MFLPRLDVRRMDRPFGVAQYSAQYAVDYIRTRVSPYSSRLRKREAWPSCNSQQNVLRAHNYSTRTVCVIQTLFFGPAPLRLRPSR